MCHLMREGVILFKIHVRLLTFISVYSVNNLLTANLRLSLKRYFKSLAHR